MKTGISSCIQSPNPFQSYLHLCPQDSSKVKLHGDSIGADRQARPADGVLSGRGQFEPPVRPASSSYSKPPVRTESTQQAPAPFERRVAPAGACAESTGRAAAVGFRRDLDHRPGRPWTPNAELQTRRAGGKVLQPVNVATLNPFRAAREGPRSSSPACATASRTAPVHSHPKVGATFPSGRLLGRHEACPASTIQQRDAQSISRLKRRPRTGSCRCK